MYFLKRAIPNKTKYLHINIKKAQYRIHRLVAYLYCYNDDPQVKREVNHLNECQYDNQASNLEWCTPKHNTNYGIGIYRAAISKSITQTNLHYKHTKEALDKLNQNRQRISEAGAKAMSRSITRTNINTGEVVIYESITKAALMNSCSNTTIYDCCRGKLKSYKNYSFSYTDGNGVTPRNKQIVQLSPDDQFIKEYANSKEVSKAGFNTYYVNRCCKGLQFISGGYKWMYLEDYNKE